MITVLFVLASAAEANAQTRKEHAKEYTAEATYYANRFEGRLTASGKRFSQEKLWAAHKKLPFGTRVRVTSLKNGKSVVVTIEDRGPYGGTAKGLPFEIDLSQRAARELGFLRDGHTTVRLEILESK